MATLTDVLDLDDAKAQLNITGTTHDLELESYISSVTDVVEHHIGPVIIREVSEERQGGPFLVLAHTPVVSLTSVTPVLSGGISYDVTTLVFNAATGVVRRGDGSAFTGGPFTVIYQAGRAAITEDVPANINLAARIIVAHLWDTQRGGFGAPRLGGDTDMAPTPMGFLVPRRALELLNPDRKAPVIA